MLHIVKLSGAYTTWVMQILPPQSCQNNNNVLVVISNPLENSYLTGLLPTVYVVTAEIYT